MVGNASFFHAFLEDQSQSAADCRQQCPLRDFEVFLNQISLGVSTRARAWAAFSGVRLGLLFNEVIKCMCMSGMEYTQVCCMGKKVKKVKVFLRWLRTIDGTRQEEVQHAQWRMGEPSLPSFLPCQVT